MMDRHHILHRRDRLGELVDELFPRQRGRDDDEDEDDDDNERERETPQRTGPRTVVRTRYRTLEPTFSGSIAGYSTRTRANTDSDDDDETTTTTSVPSSTIVKETTTTLESSSTPDVAIETKAAATDAAASSSGDGGLSGGAKAGIGIGVVAGVLALVGLVFLLLAKKRRQTEGMQSINDDEKLHGAFGPGGYAPTPAQAAAASAVASRGPGAPRTQQAMGTHAAATSAGVFRNESPRSPTGSSWERPMTSSSQNAANPFGSHAELPGSRPTTPPSNHTAVAAALAGGVGAMAGATATRGLQRKASRNHGQKQLDLTLPPPGPAPASAVPPSPARTEYSISSVPSGQQAPVTAGASAIAAAGGPPGSAVHRVQLDFEPTLEDELGLKAGQLVRLLHEYDDGWALCIRLDRSRQGVVPRTCLSTRPVKPRNGPSQSRNGPPVNPSSRPVTPKSTSPPPAQAHGSSSRPTTPGQQAAPGPRYQPMPPKPQTPTTASPARVMSPAPGPLSAPMAPPASSAVSVISSLTPSERSPSPSHAEMPASEPVAKQSPVLPPVEFTPLPTPTLSEPLSLEPDTLTKADSPAPAAPAVTSPPIPAGSEAPKRKPVPGQGA